MGAVVAQPGAGEGAGAGGGERRQLPQPEGPRQSGPLSGRGALGVQPDGGPPPAPGRQGGRQVSPAGAPATPAALIVVGRAGRAGPAGGVR